MREPVNACPAQRDPGALVQPLVAALADQQYGLVTTAQLAACGLSTSAIVRWAANGRLRRLHRGVYVVGHAVLAADARPLAAVLACGAGAALSFTDAGALWGLCHARGSRFHVTVPRGGARPGPRAGIHVHVTSLGPDDVVVRNGIPVTSVARTLLDLASVLTDEQLEEAVDRAIELRLYDARAVAAMCVRGRPGAARLRRVLENWQPDAEDTRSRWEKAMLRVVAEEGLPRPEVNAWLPELGIEPDLLWSDRMLVVEWDSWKHHRQRDVFERDRRKTVELQAAGYTVLRFTWRQTQRERAWVIGHLRRALG